MHQFLAHFILIQFDFLREGAIDPPDAINRIRGCLAPDEAAKAPLVWSRVVRLARASAGKSGQFDRARLVRLLSPVARLRGANSLRLDLDKLAELARGYASFISIVGNDVDVIGSNVWSVDAGSLVDTDSYWHTPSGDVADSFRVKFPSLGALPGRYDRRFSVSSLIQFDGSQALSLGVELYGARFVYGEPYPINPPTGVPDNSASALLLSAGLAGLTLLRRTVV